MALVLAIEPDPRQAATLKRVVRAVAHAKLVVVDSKDAALASIAACVPDLLLVSALLPPRDEDDLTRRLKTLEHATHLQTLAIPMFASTPAEPKVGGRVFGGLRRKKRVTSTDGCDPNVFGAEIEAYLQHATQLRDERRVQQPRQTPAQDSRPPAPEQAFTEQAEIVAQPEFVEQFAVAAEIVQPPPIEARQFDAAPAIVPDESPIVSAEPAVVFTEPPVVSAEPAVVSEAPPILALELGATQQPIAAQDLDVVPAPAARDLSSAQEMTAAPAPSNAQDAPAVQDAPAPPDIPVVDPTAPSRELATPRLEVATARPAVEPDPFVAAPASVIEQPSIVEHEPEPVPEQHLGAATPPMATAGASSDLEAEDTEWQDVPLDDQGGEPGPTRDIAIQDATPELPGDATERASDAGTQSVVALEPVLAAPVDHDVPAPGAKNATASEGVHAAFARALGNLHAFAERVSTGIKSRSDATTLSLRDEVAADGPPAEPRVSAPGGSGVPGVCADEDDSAETVRLAVRSEERHAESAAAPAPGDGHQPAEHDERTRATDSGRDAAVASRQEPPAATASNETSHEAAPPPPEEEHEKAAGRRKLRRRRRRAHANPPLPPGLETVLAGVDSRWLASVIAALRFDIQQLREETRTTAASTADDAPVLETDAGDGASHPDAAHPENGWANGHGNGNGHAQTEAASQQPDPVQVQDEWGFYNPERCGMQALFARLEDHGTTPPKQAAPPPDATRTAVVRKAHPPGNAETGRQMPNLKRLAPLSMWARADEQTQYRVEDILPDDPFSRDEGSTAASRLPAEVAAVRYGSGCRIHRIRVAPGPKQSAADTRQVIILSRKALENTR